MNPTPRDTAVTVSAANSEFVKVFPGVAMPPRLAALVSIEALRAARVTLLVAAPGFGKSTLLSHACATLSRSGIRVRRFTCTREHGIPSAFIHTVREHFAELGWCSGTATDEPNASSRAMPLAGALCIDDYERASTAASDQALLDLAHELPERFALVVAARHRPRVSLGRAIVSGVAQLVEGEEMRFEPEEVTALFGAAALSAEARQIVDTAAGWPAILTLTRLAVLKHAGSLTPATFLDRLRERIRDYIAGEVLAPLEPHVRAFLLDTAVLDEIAADAADSLRGAHDSHAQLQRIESLAPLVTFTSQPYAARLHPLLADVLRTELRRTDPQRLRQLHLAAAAYHANGARVYEAVTHALNARDIAHAVRVIEHIGPLALQVSEGPRGVRNLLDLLPPSVISHNVRLRITRVVQLAMEENVVEAKVEHERLEREFGAQQHLPEIARLELDIARCVTQVFDSEHSLEAPVWPSIIHAAERARRWVLDDPRLLVIPCAIELLFLLRTGQLDAAENRLNELEQLFRRLRMPRESEWNWVYRSVIHLGRLEFDAAESLLLRALRVAQDTFGDERSPIADFVHACLAKLYYNRDLIDKAQAHLASLGDAPSWNVIEVLEAMHIVRARCQLAQGRCSEALETLRNCRAVATAKSLCHLRLLAGAGEVELLARLGQLAEAQALSAEIDLPGIWQLAPDSRSLPWVDIEAAAKGLFALAIAGHDPKRADAIADRYLARANATGSVLARINAALLKTRAHQLRGDALLARETLGQAIAQMRGLDGLRLLVDAGPELVPTLRAIVDQNDDTVAQWASAVIAALEGDVRRWMSADPLFTSREQDVFAGLLRSASTKEIARQLALSPETVKTHLKAIFSKLRVRDRNEAVAEAWRRVLHTQTEAR